MINHLYLNLGFQVQDARHRGRLETAAGERRETAVLAAGRQSRWDVVLLLLAGNSFFNLVSNRLSSLSF